MIGLGFCLLITVTVTALSIFGHYAIVNPVVALAAQELNTLMNLSNTNSITNTSVSLDTMSNENASTVEYPANAGTLQVRYTGLIRSDVSPEVAQELGLNETFPGLLVTEVIPGSPAENSGIRGPNMTRVVGGEIVRLGGDIIVKVDDNESIAKDDESFVDYLQNEKMVGENVTLTILRDGRAYEIDLTLGALPAFFWYNDEDEGIKLKYPSDWRVSDNKNDKSDVVSFFSPEENTERETSTAAVIVKVFLAEGVTLDEFAVEQTEDTENTRRLDVTGTELADLQAYESTFYEYSANRTLKVKSAFTLLEDQIFRINYAADTSTYDDYLPMFEEMLKSFQFTKE